MRRTKEKRAFGGGVRTRSKKDSNTVTDEHACSRMNFHTLRTILVVFVFCRNKRPFFSVSHDFFRTPRRPTRQLILLLTSAIASYLARGDSMRFLREREGFFSFLFFFSFFLVCRGIYTYVYSKCTRRGRGDTQQHARINDDKSIGH